MTMKVFVYPLKYIGHSPVIDWDAEPQTGTLINYSEGTRDFFVESFDFMPGSFKSYRTTKLVSNPQTYAYVKIGNEVEKVFDHQCRFEKYKNEYQKVFSNFGINNDSLDRAMMIARENINRPDYRKILMEPLLLKF